MNKKIIVVTILILLVFFGTVFLTAHKTAKEILLTPIAVTDSGAKEATKSVETTLNINGANYQYVITDKTSVYDFMSQLQNSGKISFAEKDYIGMGKLVTEINGVKNSNEKSWIYYVNGKEASVGVSNYKLNPGDVVSWKYEKSNY